MVHPVLALDLQRFKCLPGLHWHIAADLDCGAEDARPEEDAIFLLRLGQGDQKTETQEVRKKMMPAREARTPVRIDQSHHVI